MKNNLFIPCDVPQENQATYITNYESITKKTGKLLLFAGDQKIEHLHDDFYGPGIAPEDNDPMHLFTIADSTAVGAFATHLGLINQFGKQFRNINYIVKLNGKTNLVPTTQDDPCSLQLWSLQQVIDLQKNTGLHIAGVGYTIYLGSTYESTMLKEAANIVYQAHQHGLLAILWVYCRGRTIKQPTAGRLIAGSTGLASSLGADFVKVPMPSDNAFDWLRLATETAGKTKVIISCGSRKNEHALVQEVHEQLHQSNTAGIAIGRNLHQRSLPQAQALTNALGELIYKNATTEQAYRFLTN